MYKGHRTSPHGKVTPPSYMAGGGAHGCCPDTAKWGEIIGQGDQFEAFLRTRADQEDAELGGVDPGDMDGDHTSGLASAGRGTDEDYGGGDW
jgi:hypothetical protein